MIAAISVAALLIPESMGYATVAGVPAQLGLYAAPLGLVGYAPVGHLAGDGRGQGTGESSSPAGRNEKAVPATETASPNYFP